MGLLELCDNIFQNLILVVMFSLSIFYASKDTKFLPLQYISGLYLSWLFGNLFWTSYYLICGDFPYYFSASEICYMANFLFIIGLSQFLFKENRITLTIKQHLISLIFPFFVLVANIFCYYMVGGFFWIAYYAIPLIVIAFLISRNFYALKNKKNLYKVNLSLAILVIILNIMYVVSCFGFNNIYILFDFLLSLTFPLIFVFVKRESDL